MTSLHAQTVLIPYTEFKKLWKYCGLGMTAIQFVIWLYLVSNKISQYKENAGSLKQTKNNTVIGYAK